MPPDAALDRHTQLRATQAETGRRWHLAVQHYLELFEQAHRVADQATSRYFAAKLSVAYRAMGMDAKATYFGLIAG